VNLYLNFIVVTYSQFLCFSTGTRELELKKAYKGKLLVEQPPLLIIYSEFCRKLILSWMSESPVASCCGSDLAQSCSLLL